MSIEAINESTRAASTEPPLADMMMEEIFSPRPVRVKVPTIRPAAARSTATGSMFFAPSIIATMILRGVSHSFRSRLRKLVRITVPMAPSAAYSGDLFQTTRIATRTTIDTRWYPLVSTQKDMPGNCITNEALTESGTPKIPSGVMYM